MLCSAPLLKRNLPICRFAITMFTGRKHHHAPFQEMLLYIRRAAVATRCKADAAAVLPYACSACRHHAPDDE